MRNRKSRIAQEGLALVTTLLALLLISGLAIGMVLMANTETSIALNFRDQQLATAAARAGLEEVRDRLRTTATNSLWSSIPTALPGAASGILYVTNGTAQPWVTTNTYADTEICDEGVTCSSLSGSWYGSASASATYAASPSLPWQWVRVMAKTNNAAGGLSARYSVDGAANENRVCWTGSHEVVTSATDCISPLQRVYETTALAVTSLGSRRMLQMEMAHDPPLGLVGANLPGAVTLVTTAAITCTTASGYNPVINGVDQNPNAPAGSGWAGIAKESGTAASCVVGTNVTGAAPYDTNPSTYNLTMPASLTPGAGLAATITAILNDNDNFYNDDPPVGANLGTCSGPTWNPRIIVIDTPGSYLNPVTGCGLLLVQVRDNITIDANINWKGPVIVFNRRSGRNTTVTFTSGAGRIDGALVCASNTGGDVHLHFDSGALSNGGITHNSSYMNYSSARPLRLIAFREVIN